MYIRKKSRFLVSVMLILCSMILGMVSVASGDIPEVIASEASETPKEEPAAPVESEPAVPVETETAVSSQTESAVPAQKEPATEKEEVKEEVVTKEAKKESPKRRVNLFKKWEDVPEADRPTELDISLVLEKNKEHKSATIYAVDDWEGMLTVDVLDDDGNYYQNYYYENTISDAFAVSKIASHIYDDILNPGDLVENVFFYNKPRDEYIHPTKKSYAIVEKAWLDKDNNDLNVDFSTYVTLMQIYKSGSPAEPVLNSEGEMYTYELKQGRNKIFLPTTSYDSDIENIFFKEDSSKDFILYLCRTEYDLIDSEGNEYDYFLIYNRLMDNDEDEPPVDEDDPPTDEEVPPVEEKDPPTDEKDPPVDEKDPPTDEKDPPVDEKDPPTDEKVPPVEKDEEGEKPGGVLKDDPKKPSKGTPVETKVKNAIKSVVPKTGDNMNMVVNALVIVVSAVALVFVIKKRKIKA